MQKSQQMVSNYSEMLNRIVMSNFLTNLIMLFILSRKIPKIFFISSFGTIPIQDFNFPFFVVIYSIIITAIFRIIKLHMIISNILNIRFYFDINNILIKMAEKCNISNHQKKKITKINRKKLMKDIFYEYASSTNNTKNTIDKHLIYKALDQWAWFWILIELCFQIIIYIIFFFIYVSHLSSLILLILLVIFIMLILYSWKLCKEYANDEIEAILSKKTNKMRIIKIFNAL